jgi:hypothetical protein
MNYEPELDPELPPEDKQGEVEPEVEGAEEEAVEEETVEVPVFYTDEELALLDPYHVDPDKLPEPSMIVHKK